MEDMTWKSEKCNVTLNFWCEKEERGEMKENKKGKKGEGEKKNKYVSSLAPLKEFSQKTNPKTYAYISMANPDANVVDKCNLPAGHIVTQFKI